MSARALASAEVLLLRWWLGRPRLCLFRSDRLRTATVSSARAVIRSRSVLRHPFSLNKGNLTGKNSTVCGLQGTLFWHRLANSRTLFNSLRHAPSQRRCKITNGYTRLTYTGMLNYCTEFYQDRPILAYSWEYDALRKGSRWCRQMYTKITRHSPFLLCEPITTDDVSLTFYITLHTNTHSIQNIPWGKLEKKVYISIMPVCGLWSPINTRNVMLWFLL